MLGNLGIFFTQGSEGIQMEYIAIFIAVLFPGALVAFNYELLQALPGFAALRVYCAGIWHNAVVSSHIFPYLFMCECYKSFILNSLSGLDLVVNVYNVSSFC